MSNFKTLALFFLLPFLYNSCEKRVNKEKQNTKLSSDKQHPVNVSKFEDNLIEDYNGKFKILKVDSISDIYMIYALKEKKYYKILSKKNEIIDKNWEKIKINNAYSLILEIKYSKRGILEHASGIEEGDGPVIYFEGDSIRDFYNSPNIKGLYYNGNIK